MPQIFFLSESSLSVCRISAFVNIFKDLRFFLRGKDSKIHGSGVFSDLGFSGINFGFTGEN